MPFTKNDPKTIEAAKLGGKTGKKHLATVTPAQQRRFGKLSGKRRRAIKEERDRIAKRKADEKAAERYQQKIMKNYLV